MLSTEKIGQAVNEKVAELLMEQIALYLETRLKEQWDKIIFELAATRKSNYQLIETFNKLIASNKRLESYVASLQNQIIKNAELQDKEDKLLSFLMKEFGMEE